MPGIIALGFPLFLFLSAIFGFYYLFRLKKRAIIFFAAILLNIPNIIHYIRLAVPAQEASEQYKIKVLSYNVNLFDFYAQADKKNAIRNKILDFIPDTKADIVCLQEYYEMKDGSFSIAASLAKNNYIYHTKRSENKKAYYGNVIYSRFPIIEEGYVGDFACYADILVSKKDTIRVFSMHLYSNKLSKDDHRFYNNAISGKETTDYTEGTSKILSKIRLSASIRQKQISILLKSVSETPYRVILCGDMNETPISYSYNQFAKISDDVFLDWGSGTSSTYNGIFPAYRIDYIFYRTGLTSGRNLKAVYYNRYSVKYSDHFPITAAFN
jgi:endonuclease/exonuclease/phosphatase family metal-dependent hydrolase